MFVSGYFVARLQSLNKRPFSKVFMLVSCLFCRLVARYHQIAVVSFAENGRFSGSAKDGFMICGSYYYEKTEFS
jgi:hypothetical protein